jgi:hypothetical protein
LFSLSILSQSDIVLDEKESLKLFVQVCEAVGEVAIDISDKFEGF